MTENLLPDSETPVPEGTPEIPVPWWRNVWFWSFVAGAIVLVLIRPLTRHVPEAPPVVGQLPNFGLLTEEGESFTPREMAGSTWVVTFLAPGCGSPECNLSRDAFREMARLFREGQVTVRLLGVTVRGAEGIGGPAAPDPSEPGAVLVSGAVAEVEALGASLLDVAGAAGAEGAFRADAPPPRMYIVDSDGGVRGGWDLRRHSAVDEVLHRSVHVERRQGER